MSRDGGEIQNTCESLADQNLRLQKPQLVAPLREDTDSILNERHNDQETSNRRQMRPQRLRVYLDIVLDLFP